MRRSLAGGPDGGRGHGRDSRHAVRGAGGDGVLDRGDERRGQADGRGEDHGERQRVRGGRRVVGVVHRAAAGDQVQVPWEGDALVRAEQGRDGGGVERRDQPVYHDDFDSCGCGCCGGSCDRVGADHRFQKVGSGMRSEGVEREAA